MTLSRRICLGTAQFGLDYGISNTSGRVSEAEVEKILKRAVEENVHWLDTAADYGSCEETLQRFPELLSKFKIATKFPKLENERADNFASIRDFCEKRISETCQNFSREKIDLFYLRSPEKLFELYGNEASDWIDTLKETGYVSKIGVSVYKEAQIELILKYFKPDVVQVPCSIIDQRLIDAGILKDLKRQKIEIYVRSIFLQGLIFMNPSQLSPYFYPIQKHLEFIRDYLDQQNVTALQASLAFIFSQDMIDRVIIGVNSLQQWNEILSELQKPLGCLPDWSVFKIADERFVNPALWKV